MFQYVYFVSSQIICILIFSLERLNNSRWYDDANGWLHNVIEMKITEKYIHVQNMILLNLTPTFRNKSPTIFKADILAEGARGVPPFWTLCGDVPTESVLMSFLMWVFVLSSFFPSTSLFAAVFSSSKFFCVRTASSWWRSIEIERVNKLLSQAYHIMPCYSTCQFALCGHIQRTWPT